MKSKTNFKNKKGRPQPPFLYSSIKIPYTGKNITLNRNGELK